MAVSTYQLNNTRPSSKFLKIVKAAVIKSRMDKFSAEEKGRKKQSPHSSNPKPIKSSQRHMESASARKKKKLAWLIDNVIQKKMLESLKEDIKLENTVNTVKTTSLQSWNLSKPILSAKSGRTILPSPNPLSVSVNKASVSAQSHHKASVSAQSHHKASVSAPSNHKASVSAPSNHKASISTPSHHNDTVLKDIPAISDITNSSEKQFKT